MRLAKQKHEIAMRKMELEIQMEQMALQELEEDHRQRVAAAKLDEADLMDNHSLFSHHSSELTLFKDRGSDRSQGLVQDWVNSFPAGNSSELNFSRPGSATADPPVKDTSPSNPPENPSNVADNLHHLEMLSQYTRPGVAISVAQQEALYREYLQAQLQQPLTDQRVEQAHSPSGSGKVNQVYQVPVDVQNVALPPPQPPMQPPRPPTPVMAPTNSIFVPDFSKNPQVNQFLGPKSSSVPCQLHMSMPHVPQQQNTPQSNIPHQTQVPIAHSSQNVPPLLNPLVNPPPVFPPQQLYNPQPPMVPSPIPASATAYLHVPNIPQQNIVHSPQTRLVPCPTEQRPPQNCNLDLNLWSFPQNKPPNVNQATNNATVYKNVQPYLHPSTANPTISHPILQMSAQHNPNSNYAATCSIPVNSFSTTTNIAPPFVTPVIKPTYGHTAPIPLCWGGPPHPTPPAPTSENASLIKALTDALTSKRNDPLPEWKLSQYNGDPLQWHEWYGQFKSAIDSQSLTDDVKLTYLKTLVTGKAKTAIAEFAYCGAMYKDALKTLERKFGQPQAVVSAHLDKLNSFPPLKMHNSDNIINYSGCISSLVGVFKSLSYDSDLKSAALLNTAVQKLPPNMKESWSLFTVKKRWVKPTLLDFNDWLKEKAEAHDLMKNTATKARTEDTNNSVTRSKVASKAFAANTQQKSNPKPQQRSPSTSISSCIVCKGSHRLWECRVFKEKTPTQRDKVVAEAKLCFSCLRDKHMFRQCPSPRKCRKDGCNSSHNTLLHGAERVFPAKPSTNKNIDTSKSNAGTSRPSTGQQQPSKTTTLSSVTDVKGLLQVTELKLTNSSGTSTTALVLCDTACSNSWVSDSLAARLGLQGTALKLTVKGINTEELIDTKVVQLTVTPHKNQDFEAFTVRPYVRETLNVGSDIIDVKSMQETYPHLAVLDPVRYSYGEIEMILGQDVYHAIRPLEYFSADEKCSPFAVRLPIGWVLSGPLPSSSSLVSTCFKANIEQDFELACQVKSWYDMESYGAFKQVDPRSAADARAQEILETTTFHNGQRYDVGMLWADDNIQLPNNYFSSLVQLKSLEKRLSRDTSLKETYANTIREDLEKGYLKTVPDAHKVEQRSDREWYLPHHPVINPNKPGKVRRVLNGAAKFHGTSLNKSLLTGPDLLQNLIHVLLRFRQHKFAVSADIEGMFLQVGVPDCDQPSLRFLWREDPTTNVVVYQYTRHIFGAKDSPTCANYALQRTARDSVIQYPEATKAVLENFYMDDYLDSVESPERALKRSKELVQLLHLGGFKLTKFVSNVPNLADRIDGSSQSTEPKVIASSKEESSHVLGLKWDHNNDTLVVSRGTSSTVTKSLTQRLVLSLVSKVFDPIGLVAPFTVGARLLLKDIWRVSGQHWDEELPKDTVERFLEWSVELPKLAAITIPRSYFSGNFEYLELHMFGDSSQEVFSAVAFLRARVTTSSGPQTELAFVLGKARVAPMKVMTVPKLELQAALLAARLKQDICRALTVKVNRIFMWTDSTTVLQWLNSATKHPIFIANRVCEILEHTSVDEWNHVASSDNPADAGTPGMSAEVLQSSSWVRGPDFLRTKEFPFEPSIEVVKNIKLGVVTKETDETNTSLAVSVTKSTKEPRPQLIPFDKYSSYQKLLRITAYALRLLPSHECYRNADGSIIDPTELDEAERHLQYLVQGESFNAERKILLENKPVKRSSRIAPLSPFIGPNRLIRSAGRIKRLVEVDFDVKHPIVLDARHAFVKLFLRHTHVKHHHHQGIDYLRAKMEERYTILKLRSSLRSIKSNCVTCRMFRAATIQPIMADLTVERLAYQSPPFTNTGVDYFGPFYVTVRRTTEKRWGFLFTCLTTRAVHVEIVPSMDASSCVMGVERFVSRRGTPAIIWSDNGTNFVGAEKELRENIEKWNTINIAVELAHKGIKWRFNPPSAPHQGGIWERLVRSFKRVLYTILGTRRLTDEVLSTTFCLVEHALNSRPLTPVSADPSDLGALTPNHSLLGNQARSFPSIICVDEFDHRKRYARAQSYANAIWSRWIKEYVPALNRRSKWQTPAEHHLKTGDLVWVVEETNPRGYYPTSRITELRYGSDSVARSAVLLTSSGKLVRPLVKLVPILPASSSGPEDVSN